LWFQIGKVVLVKEKGEKKNKMNKKVVLYFISYKK